jgi:hypothetical protein
MLYGMVCCMVCDVPVLRNSSFFALGVAYTLLTPKEGSFAVDLVQNLNMSNQMVPAQLLQLAQSDPKWSRVRHITGTHTVGPRSSSGGVSGGGSSGFASDRGGLGFGESGIKGGRASVALTSSMIASSSFHKNTANAATTTDTHNSGNSNHYATQAGAVAPPPVPRIPSLPPALAMKFKAASASAVPVPVPTSTLSSTSLCVPQQQAHNVYVPPPMSANTDFAANPYMAGRSAGRGKHLNQPAWMTEDSSGSGATGGSGASVASGATATSAQYAVPISEPAIQQFMDASSCGDASAAGAGGSGSVPVQRKSRFDSSGFDDSSSGGVVGTTSEGKGTNSTSISLVEGHAVSTTNPPGEPVRKKSRWDS